MGLLDDISNILTPHASRLNQTIASTGVFLHSKLDAIEEAIRESAQADWNDRWFRLNFKKKIKGEEELAECPVNEIWAIQAITVDGLQEKSPAFIVLLDQRILLFSVIKEGLGTENVSGNIVVLPGETISILAREEGAFSFTIHMLRHKIQVKPTMQHSRAGELVQGRNTHDPERDIIRSKTGIYVGSPRETESVDPTVP